MTGPGYSASYRPPEGEWQEVRLDISEQVAPDIIGTITDMEAVADGSMDALWSSHNIEHVFPHEALCSAKWRYHGVSG